MGMFDTFIDGTNFRTSQCKAFERMLNEYQVGDLVYFSDNLSDKILKKPNYIYVDTLVPYYLLKLEVVKEANNKARFLGIYSYENVKIEDLISPDNLYIDYYGGLKSIDIRTYDNNYSAYRLWKYVLDMHLTNGEISKLPYLYKEMYNNEHLCSKCNKKREEQFHLKWKIPFEDSI